MAATSLLVSGLSVFAPTPAQAAQAQAGTGQTAASGAIAGIVPLAAGNPGVPSAGEVVYEEDFENVPGDVPVLLDEYTSADGHAYTADDGWLTGCNGAIVNYGIPYTDLGNCGAVNSSANLRQLAWALGQYSAAADPAANDAVAAFTENNPGANMTEFETVDQIDLADANGRFLTFSVDAAAKNCNVSAPQYQFSFLSDTGAATPVGGAVNACANGTPIPSPAVGPVAAVNVNAGTYTSNGSVLFDGASLGLRMVNANGSGIGNDAAFDNIRILDVTPQLDKDFAPETVAVGDVSTLTLTVTNTDELAAKDGWGFTDTLPTGLTIANTPALGGTCDAAVDAPAGGDTITVTDGSLAAGDTSCTITVNVTSNTAGSYTNGADNMDLTGLNPPADSTVTFEVPGTFVCSTDGYLFHAVGGANSEVTAVDLAAGTSRSLGTLDADVNAVGYNALDGYFYGWSGPLNSLVRIGSDLRAVPLSLAPGSPADVGGNVGDITPDGHMFIGRGGSGTNWYEIDLDSSSPTYLQVVDSGTRNLPGATNLLGVDWSWIGGYLYSVMLPTSTSATPELLRLDPSTSTTVNLGAVGVTLPTPASGYAFGATYADADGYLYASENTTGIVLRIDVETLDAVRFATTEPSTGNDGARCSAAPVPIDFGDAPASYGTTAADDGARHAIPAYDIEAHTAPVMLGDSIDIESDGQPTDAADGDDENGTADEDGVVINPDLAYPNPTLRTGLDPVSLQPVENTLEVTASADGFVSAWVDWNGDGDFADDGEQVANAQAVTAGANDVTFDSDDDTTGISSYVRVRYSTDADAIATPTGTAPDGEVEDYRVLVQRLVTPDVCAVDDTEYTAFIFNAPIDHVGDGGVGSSARYPNVAVVDGVPIDMIVETVAGSMQTSDAQPNGFILGGGGVIGPDDAQWQVNRAATVHYSFVEAGTDTPVEVNGVFTINDLDGGNASETATFDAADLSGYAISTGSAVEITETADEVVFHGVGSWDGDPESRFQITFDGLSEFDVVWTGSSNSGFGFDGDGDLSIDPPACSDFGDAPESYGTLLADDGASHQITPGLTLGTEIDFDADGQPTDAADGDDSNRTADEDGVAAPIVTTAGQQTTVTVSATNDTDEDATLAGWIDLDANGTFDAAELVSVTVPASSGTEDYELTFPQASANVDSFARFRLFPGAVTAPSPTGAADGGEVEDYATTSEIPTVTPPMQTCTAEGITATQRWWYFGNGGAIDFGADGSTPTAFAGNQNTMEGSTVVTDVTGALQFWSNGQTVFDRNGDPMPNGAGLLGNPSATQTVAAFPAVGNPGVYYVVTTSTDIGDAPNGDLTYSVVDMKLNGGLGDVTDVKNVPLGAPDTASEAITAVPNADGTGFWALTYTNESPNMLAYAFGADGPITGEPVVSVMPTAHRDGYGSIAFSADYTRAVVLSAGAGAATGTALNTVRVLRFDGESGEMFQELEWLLPQTADSGGLGYNAEFSPSGRYIYATKIFNGAQLYRYDLEDAQTGAEVKATEEALGSPGTTGGQIRRAPDGKMYVANRTADSLGVVNAPDAADPDFVPNGFPLAAGTTSQFGLPQMVTGCPPAVPALDVEKTSDMTEDSRPGDTVTYTLTATNTGETDFDDDYPAVVFDDLSGVLDDAEYAEDASAEASDGSDVADPSFIPDSFLSWSGPIAAGESVTITYSVTLAGGGDGEVRNVAWQPSVTPPPGNPPTDIPECDPVDDDGNDAQTGEPCATTTGELPKLTVVKAADTDDLPADGDTVTYTVTVTNEGPGDYTDDAPAEITDDLSAVLDDADFGEISAPTTGAAFDEGEQQLTWSGVLEAGESIDIVYTVVYDANAADGDHQLTNTVCIPEDEALDPDLDCDTVRVPAAALIMDKTVDPEDGTAVTAGQQVTYTLSFTNEGEAPAAVDALDSLTDVLDDATLDGDPVADAGLTASVDGDELSVTGEVPVGETLTVTYTATVNEFAEQGDHVLGNVLSNDDGTCQPGGCPETENPVRHYTVDKTADPDDAAVHPGDVVSYTVTIVNDGTADYTAAAPVQIADDLSAVLDDATYNDDGAAVVSGDAGVQLPVPAVDGDELSWSGAIAVGQTVEITYSVTVNAPVSGDGELTNAVIPTGPGGDCGPDGCTTTTDVQAYELTKAASATEVVPGDTITYTVTVTNTGQVAYTADEPASFTDDLSEVLDDATYNDDASNGAAVQDGVLSWSGPLAVGEEVVVTYSVTVNDPLTGDGSLANAAVPNVPGGICEEGDCETTTPIRAFTFAKEASATNIGPGEVVTYTVTVTNTGQVDYTDDVPASFTDDLSEVLDDATYNDDATSGATVTDGVLTWSDALEVGEEVVITYSVTVNDSMTGDGELHNTVTTDIPGGGCDECETTTEYRDYTVEKSSSTTVTNPGDTVTYTITVAATGPGEYTDDDPIVISDDLSGVLDDATYNDDATNRAVYDEPTLRWSLALAGGEQLVLTYSVTVDDPVAGDGHLRNVVDPGIGTCLDADACTTDTPIASYTVHKTVDSTDAAAGDTVTYTITVVNTGQADYTDDSPASFTDDLSEVLDDATYNDDATGGAVYDAPVLSWAGALGIGETHEVTYSLDVQGDGDGAMTNTVVPGDGGVCDDLCTTDTGVHDPELPRTGLDGAGVAAGVGAGLLVILAGLGLVLFARRRRVDE